MEFTHLNATMHYEIYGSGPRTLLLLHGWGGRIDSWLPVIRDFQSRGQVIAVDFPAHGQSPEPTVPWTVREYMEMVAELLRSRSIQSCDVMAHSFGGRVAIRLAATYPELTGKLILTGCAGLPPRKTLRYRVRQGGMALLRRLAHVRWLRAWVGETRIVRLRECLQNRFGSADYRALSPVMKETFKNVVNQDLSADLPRIRSSTLLLWGRNDTETPLWMGERMEQLIPDAGLAVLEQCGHFAYLERYPDFRVICERYLYGS